MYKVLWYSRIQCVLSTALFILRGFSGTRSWWTVITPASGPYLSAQRPLPGRCRRGQVRVPRLRCAPVPAPLVRPVLPSQTAAHRKRSSVTTTTMEDNSTGYNVSDAFTDLFLRPRLAESLHLSEPRAERQLRPPRRRRPRPRAPTKKTTTPTNTNVNDDHAHWHQRQRRPRPLPEANGRIPEYHD